MNPNLPVVLRVSGWLVELVGFVVASHHMDYEFGRGGFLGRTLVFAV
jgi:hypothetical protein